MVDERAALLESLRRLWQGWSDFRFGQMLRIAVGDEAVRRPESLDDASVVAGVSRALRDRPGTAPPSGPYWDTETSDGTFLDGLPRDPSRIEPVIEALGDAWSRHPSLALGQLIARALDERGVRDNEYRSRLLLIEDAALRRALVDLA